MSERETRLVVLIGPKWYDHECGYVYETPKLYVMPTWYRESSRQFNKSEWVAFPVASEPEAHRISEAVRTEKHKDDDAYWSWRRQRQAAIEAWEAEHPAPQMRSPQEIAQAVGLSVEEVTA